MQERYSTEAKVYGVALSVFKTILNYMYTGTIKLTEDNVMDILVACDYLQMDGEVSILSGVYSKRYSM